MKLISHRGNINGRLESYENEPNYVDLAIKKGYDVEVDVWYVNDMLWLGHDKPDYGVDFRWFRDRIAKLWIHCKNLESVCFFNTNSVDYPFNYFWHQTDDITLTSLNYIWAYPGKQPIENSVAVMPELHNDNTSLCFGVCSDFIENYI